MSSASSTMSDTATSKFSMKDGSMTIHYPLLMKDNYSSWALKMRVFMGVNGVWDAIEPTNEAMDSKKDSMALAAIYQSISEETLMLISEKKTAKEAWEMLKTMHMGVERVREAKIQTLRWEFECLRMGDAETVDDFAMKLTTNVNRIRALGDKVEETYVVRKLLRAVPEKFLQIVSTMEQFGDLKTMTLEEVIGSLKAHEERLSSRQRPTNEKVEERVLLTESEWKAKYDTASSSSKGRGGGRHFRGRGRGRGHGRNGGRGDGPTHQEKTRDKSKLQCYKCRKFGHFANECHSEKTGDKAHFAKRDDNAPALLKAELCGLGHSEKCEDVLMLNEEKVMPNLHEVEAWYLDTGASNHMTGCKEKFSDLDESVKGNVKFGDESVVNICGRGTILFQCQNGQHLTLSNVYYIPKLRSNIVSIGQLDEHGCASTIKDGSLKIFDNTGRLLANVKRSRNRLYVLDLSLAQPVCLMVNLKEKSWLWHARYGHLNFPALRSLAHKKMVEGMPVLGQQDQLCDGCLVGKQHRMPFPSSSTYRAEKPLQLIHADLCGPITPATPGGNQYFLLCVDDFSRYMWIDLIKSKDEAFNAFKKIKSLAEMEVDLRLKMLRTDRGGEFTSKVFSSYCEGLGIKRQLTAPYSPQQNGVVERRNQTIIEMARSLLKSKNMPSFFWGEAVNTAVHILNRAPTKSIEGMTPYEAWCGRKPKVHYLRVFGCVAHMKNMQPHLKKLEDRSNPMVFLGYEDGSKAYRLYDPVHKKLHVSRDVRFEEDKAWYWEQTPRKHNEEESDSRPVGSFIVLGYNEDGAPEGAPENREDRRETAAATDSTPVPTGAPNREQAVASQSSTRASPVSEPLLTSPTALSGGFSPETPTSSSMVPRKYRSLEDIYQQEEEDEDILLMTAEEPASHIEAEQHECWRLAMREELESIVSNNTWELVHLPAGHKPIGLRWVYKVKKDSRGAVVKHKARLVAKGYVQRQGVDFNEVFAPVARLETVKLILALAAQRGWEVHHMDVKSAFLNGDLIEEVYVSQPPGFVEVRNEQKVLKLRKALYGLRQAPRAWNSKLDKSLTTLGFERCPQEHAVYKKSVGSSNLLVGVYVDDLIITGSNVADVAEFKTQMKQLFSMSDLGLLSYYLGIEVEQSSQGTSLCQSAYAASILDKNGMAECNSCQTPMEARLKLSKVSPNPPVDATNYRSIVGMLRYLVHTRPDISYAVGIVSRYMEAPTTQHMAAVKQILRYLRGTLRLGCFYAKEEEKDPHLIGFSDADLAGDVDDRKSTTGWAYFLGSSMISWASQKQKIVALSSCEAEYIAAATAAQQGVWLGQLLADLVKMDSVKVTLKVDNKSAISLCKNPVYHDRSKHIDTRYHYIRECVDQGNIAVEHVSTENQLADILTKPLGRVKFLEMRQKIGLQETKTATRLRG